MSNNISGPGRNIARQQIPQKREVQSGDVGAHGEQVIETKPTTLDMSTTILKTSGKNVPQDKIQDEVNLQNQKLGISMHPELPILAAPKIEKEKVPGKIEEASRQLKGKKFVNFSDMSRTVRNEDYKGNRRGILISFEGSEGSGKTTQIGRLAKALEGLGMDVLVTREPGGTEIGEEIRHLLKHTHFGNNMCAEAELLLFAASRAQLVREKLLPNIEAGKIILCDRFLDSTTVYQGAARQIADDPIEVINRFAVGDLVPDLTIVIDVCAEEGLRRVRHRASDLPDRMEQENIDFYQRVREGYLVLAESLPDRFVVVDGSGDLDEVEAQVWGFVQERFFSDLVEKCS